MTNLGYIGEVGTPEYNALISRTDAAIVASTAAERSPDSETTIYGSAEDLIQHADIDGLVIATPPDRRAAAASPAIQRGLPFYIVPPVSASIAEAVEIADAVTRANLVTAVSRPIRYSVNLVQIKQTVQRDGAGFLTARYVGPANGSDCISKSEPLIDLLRYVGGNVESVECYHRSDRHVTAELVLSNGARALLSAIGGWIHGEKQGFEAITGAGSRMTWAYGPNMLTLDAYETRAGDTVEGTHTASLAAFITAIRTGSRAQILADISDSIGTIKAVEAIEAASV